MKVKNNIFKNINMEETYLTKKCTCGSDLIITIGDIYNIVPDEDGKVYISCPCCSSKIELYKYFGGKKYDFYQYAECAAVFEKDVYNVTKVLSDINIGFKTEFFTLSKLDIIPCPAKIFFDTYIDIYKHGDWEKIIKKCEQYENNLTIDISEKIACTSIYEYAQYTQALVDYILEMIFKNNYWYYKNPPSGLIFNVNTEYLTQIFRDPDVNISDFYFNPSGLYKTINRYKIEEKTVFTPDINNGLEYVGEKIENGCNNISNSLYKMSCSMHNSAIMNHENINLYKQV